MSLKISRFRMFQVYYIMDDNGDRKNTRNGTFCFHRIMIDMGVNEIWKQEKRIWADIAVENDTPDERNNLVWEHGQVNEIQWDRCGCEKTTQRNCVRSTLINRSIYLPDMDNVTIVKQLLRIFVVCIWFKMLKKAENLIRMLQIYFEWCKSSELGLISRQNAASRKFVRQHCTVYYIHFICKWKTDIVSDPILVCHSFFINMPKLHLFTL